MKPHPSCLSCVYFGRPTTIRDLYACNLITMRNRWLAEGTYSDHYIYHVTRESPACKDYVRAER